MKSKIVRQLGADRDTEFAEGSISKQENKREVQSTSFFAQSVIMQKVCSHKYISTKYICVIV